MIFEYRNKIALRRCPRCDRMRPLDWYGFEAREHGACWLCRQREPRPRPVRGPVVCKQGLGRYL
ncbi:MAG: hypothetical protein Q4B35_06610 [Slackia sp.]|nr:hypothetical protein [Slackia sp.]